MPDYKQMYLEMVRATERAIAILAAAQRKCEECYISCAETELTVLLPQGKHEKSVDSPPQRAQSK